MNSFYTGKGDDGSTGVLGEGRLPKHHLRMEALGTLDEANAALGMARASTTDSRIKSLLVRLQTDLYQLMAEVAATPENAEKFMDFLVSPEAGTVFRKYGFLPHEK